MFISLVVKNSEKAGLANVRAIALQTRAAIVAGLNPVLFTVKTLSRWKKRKNRRRKVDFPRKNLSHVPSFSYAQVSSWHV